MSSNEAIEPITKEELKVLLDHIRAYQQDSSTYGTGTKHRGLMELLDEKNHGHRDFHLAASTGSPLTPFFAALVVLDKKEPELLSQDHLDSMRTEFYNERSRVFNDFGRNGGQHVVNRLEKHNLVVTITDMETNEPFPQLNWSFYKLAVTPLDDVKKMVSVIKAESSSLSWLKSSSAQGSTDDNSLERILFRGSAPPGNNRDEAEERAKAGKKERENALAREEEFQRLRQFWQNEDMQRQMVAMQQALMERAMSAKLERQRSGHERGQERGGYGRE